MLVAPASANVIGKLANGIADDMLTTTVMACECKKIVAPAMNTHMYKNPVVQDNIKKLKGYGMEVVEPDKGYLACGDIGEGKMPSEQVQGQRGKKSTLSVLFPTIPRGKWDMPLQGTVCSGGLKSR